MPVPVNILLTISLLAFLIFVHELGHFLAAKLFRVKVLKFSLGFGPRLLGFTKGETEYRISAIPLGGYVKMAGEDPSEEMAPEDKGRTFSEQAPWKRAVIGLAGPAMNLAFPVLFYFLAFYFQTADISSRIGRVIPGQPAYTAGLRSGDRITSIDGTPVHYFHELQRLIGSRAGIPTKITFERRGSLQTVEIVPARKEDENPIETEVRGVIGVGPEGLAAIAGISDPESPAAKAGLQTFDKIVKIDGANVDTATSLEELLSRKNGQITLSVARELPAAQPETKAKIRASPPAEQILEIKISPEERDSKLYWGIEPIDTFVYQVKQNSPAWEAGLRKGDKLVEINGAGLVSWEAFDRARYENRGKPIQIAFIHEGKRVSKEVAEKKVVDEEIGHTVWVFGAVPDIRASRIVKAEKIPVDPSISKSLERSLRVVPDQIRMTGLVLVRLIQGKISFNTVGSPIAMYGITSRAAEDGLESFLEIMALISINLGVMNLLPIPVLDGFHILSAGLETVRRRPLTMQAKIIANYIGLALLLTLMVFAFKNDITRIIRGTL